MNILDHWHPILPREQLKDKPVEVQLANQRIVLFRHPEQGIAALDIRCPHRGMDLSYGKVQTTGLACRYHGWTFDAQGQGYSPCNPKLKTQTTAYTTREYADFIWLSGPASQAPFPAFLLPNYAKVGVHLRRVQAPIEPVIDNFLEVEHFPTAHQWLGYGVQQINEANLVIEKDEQTVQMGFYPIEPLYPLVRKIFQLPVGSRYFMDITAHNSPLYTVHHQGWLNPANNQKKTLLINVVFYVPLNPSETLLVMFLLAEPGRFSLLKNAFIRQKTGQLIDDDLVILNNLVGKNLKVQDMRLGAHDKALIEVRKRLPQIYADYYPKETGKQ
jgi:phenylpropionate dioxygenase-like ring-hydroxylating dioxygenase large terminal subunit